MAKVTIDHQTFEFEGSPMVLQFCLDNEVDVPHFCYHPAMSAPANCRQCLIEVGMPDRDRATGHAILDEDGNPVIQFMPKLMTSCTQPAADGMVIRTHRSSDIIRRAQKDNLEFLLINHPLDCPICDQAGNCPLQIQAYKFGPESSRFEFEKSHKPKQIELGPNVMLDGERCINCTRCTRFTDEISESHQLTIIERGVDNYPMTPPGVVFDEPYSMNVIDICPVGALTSRDFRFKARVWEMSSTPSITTTNAKGSNCHYWVQDNLIMKVTPRTNMFVNEYWLADEDRLDYRRFNDNRPSGPTVDGDPVTWDLAYEHARGLLAKCEGAEILFVGSSSACVEDNFLLGRMAASLGADTPVFVEHAVEGAGDNWLVTDDKTPNREGCLRLDMHPLTGESLRSRLSSGEIKVLYVLEEDLITSGLCSAEDLSGVQVIVHDNSISNQLVDLAAVTLPAAMIVETVGTYVSENGYAQKSVPAKAIRAVNRTLMMSIGKSRADMHGTPFDKWHHEENLVDCLPGWVSIPEVAHALGQDLSFKGPRQIIEELADSNEAFAGLSYEGMGEIGIQLEEVAATA
ncbi:MAG: (2Fe-2S)-binding protein [Bacteroidetes bacterium]|nr:MAG: (2Fe-2S)-binding protein [Bacteroidota bacterium]